MKLAAAIIAKLTARKDDQPDAFEQRLMSLGAQKSAKAQRYAKPRHVAPALFVRQAHA